jgi:hypothetical protein
MTVVYVVVGMFVVLVGLAVWFSGRSGQVRRGGDGNLWDTGGSSDGGHGGHGHGHGCGGGSSCGGFSGGGCGGGGD